MTELAHLPSRTPTFPRRAALRTDPYWSSIWRAGSSGEWFSVADFHRLNAAGVARVPRWLRMAQEDARRRVESSAMREQVMRVLASLSMWRTLTIEQTEAVCGIAHIGRGDDSLVSALWNAGLIDVCVLGQTLIGERHARGVTLLRPARVTPYVRSLEQSWTWPEWVSVTAGLGLDNNRQFARHNVLASEFGLRMAEFGNVATVLGERLSGMDVLGYSGVGKQVPTTGASNGSDLVLVRPDGLRVAVEVTASKVGGWFYDKAEKLIKILHRRPLAETGLCVLFLTAPHQDATAYEHTEGVRLVKRAVQKAVRAYPGTALDSTAQRVGVASWADLFPAPGQVRDDLGKLPIERPTGPGFLGDPHDEHVWEKSYFLSASATPFTPHDPSALTSVIDTASGLRGTPHMLRRERQDSGVLSRLAVHNFGLEKMPFVSGALDPMLARGATAAPLTPARLRF